LTDSITCPRCGATSHHPRDIEEGYCGRCHDWTAVPVTLPPTVRAAGDPRPKQATWTLLPVDTRAGACSQCGRDHDPDQPHDKMTLAYKYAFYAEHDRWPTWADAMAHCTPEVQAQWRDALRGHGIPEGQL